MDLADRLRCPSMEPAPAQCAHSFGYGGGDQGVYEGEAHLAAVDLLNQLRPLGGFERVDQRLLLQLAGHGQRLVLELPAQDRGQAEHLLGSLGQCRHPRLDGHAHALGDGQLAHLRAVPVAAFEMDLARFDQRLAHLFDEEGIAFRFSEDPVQELGGDLLLEDGEQQILGFPPG